MKILMTADTIGGVWSYAMQLCASARAHGLEIALATLGAPLSRAQHNEVASLANVQLYESEYRLEWMPSPWESLTAAGEWLLSLERQFSPDVVHLNHLVHAELAWRAPVLVVGHSCVYSWWHAVRGGKPDDSWKEYRKRVTASLSRAQVVVAPSQYMLDALCRYYGPFRRAHVIPNARDPEMYRPMQKEPFVFSAGRLWDEAKDVAALCEVAPWISWPVFVAGDDVAPDGQETRRLEHVTFLGKLGADAMARWLGCASIYAAPARYEPFGLGALEAGLSGCALVLSDLESLREVWGDSALYFPPRATDELRDVLLDLLAHPRALPVLGERARARASRFHPRRFVSSYLGLYRSLSTREPVSCASYCSITP